MVDVLKVDDFEFDWIREVRAVEEGEDGLFRVG